LQRGANDTLLAAGLSLATKSPLPLVARGVVGALHLLPEAVGTQYSLPPVNPSKGWFSDTPLSRHQMDWVISGLEQQKEEDQRKLVARLG
jgi:hypothetical protein